MKRLGIVLAVVGLAASVQANMVNRGVRELRLQGMIDSSVDININLEAGYGYFIRDFWELGGLAGVDYRDGGDDILLRGLGFIERTFDIESATWMPYVGGGAGLFVSDTDADSDFGAEGMGYGGLKDYVEDNLAIGFEGRITLATADIYRSDDGEFDMYDWAILISTRFFY